MIELIVLFSVIALLAVGLVYVPVMIIKPADIENADVDLADKKNQNTDLFRDKKRELELDKEVGLISEGEYAECLKDLERSLLADIPEQIDGTSSNNLKKYQMLLILLLIPLFSFSYYFFTSPYQSALSWIELRNSFSESIEGIASGNSTIQNELDNVSMADFIRLMQADMQQKNPTAEQAAMGWYLLGVSYLKVKNFDSALYALKRADEAEPENEDVIFSYAQALIFKNNGQHTQDSANILNQLLGKNPNHQGALMLSGVTSYNGNDYVGAINSWQRLLDLRQKQNTETGNTNSGMQGQDLLLASIATAKKKLIEGNEAENTTNNSKEKINKPVLKIKIQLIKNLRKQIKPGSSMFVFAKAFEGPGMPLAVVRYPDIKLPMNVQFDDSFAMTPKLKLSDFNKVVVTARITQQGKAQLSPGDLEGVSDVIELKPGMNKVYVTIDRLIE